jgi:cyclopropane fatty-acyl-phospholipid synthase-like methyltransferase
MDRISWLKEKRREAEERYSTLWALLYWEKFGLYANETHQQFIREFIKLLPQNSAILDAASGAGRYLPLLLAEGYSIIAIDQSEGMLARAKERFPAVQFEKVGLQEISYQELFDGATCMDAMEHVSPEDWPLVISNFHRALKEQGYLYFTVEIIEEAELQAAFARGQQLGWPVVYGELADEDVYHYYPSLEQVREWLQQAGFVLQREGEGNLYHHFIVRKE